VLAGFIWCEHLLATLAEPKLSGATGELKKLLQQERGLTLITESTDAARSFVLTSFGHSWSSLSGLVFGKFRFSFGSSI
jgi:hypothetical protein